MLLEGIAVPAIMPLDIHVNVDLKCRLVLALDFIVFQVSRIIPKQDEELVDSYLW
jgi:hypothetical protein